jgi:hypothetical protein
MKIIRFLLLALVYGICIPLAVGFMTDLVVKLTTPAEDLQGEEGFHAFGVIFLWMYLTIFYLIFLVLYFIIRNEKRRGIVALSFWLLPFFLGFISSETLILQTAFYGLFFGIKYLIGVVPVRFQKEKGVDTEMNTNSQIESSS